MIIDLTKKTKLLTGGKACPEDIEICPVLQEKEVTANGAVVPDDGYAGLSKVTVDVPDTVMGNIGRPNMPKFSRLKFFYDDASAIGYKDVYPSNAGETLGVTSKTSSGSVASKEDMLEEIYNDYGLATSYARLTAQEIDSCVAGEKKYFGHPCTSISAMWEKRTPATVNYLYMPSIYIPPCTCKVFSFDVENGTISSAEYAVDPIFYDARSEEKAIDRYNYAYDFFNICCNTAGGLILAAEFTYPKGDITFLSEADGLEYSLDDGVTFSAVTDELELEQIEHVALRNTSADKAVYIGTTEGGREIAEIGTEKTRYIEVIDDATWYVFR